MRLTRYGIRELLIATLATSALCVGIVIGALWCTPWWLAGLVVILPLWVFVLCFFRDPNREIPSGAGLFVSPADGCVSDITPVGSESALGQSGTRIAIFMSVFNVHVNRMPCDGRIESIAHTAGAFLDVRDPAASERNESTAIRMTHTHDGKEYPIVVRQIAGLVARRIVTDLAEGQSVTRGQRCGMIKFGSRLEVLIPEGLLGEVRVDLGRRVQAGATILAVAKSVSP